MAQFPTVIIIDNSTSFTGAFKCALQQAILMQDVARYIFVLPQGSHCITLAKDAGFAAYTLPMLEINKSIGRLLQYPLRLLSNATRLRKIIKAEGASVVVMNDFYNLLGVALKIAGAQFRLITYVRFLPQVMPAPLRKIWIEAALRYADDIVAVSGAVVQQLPAHSKVQCIYDAVSFPQQRPAFTVQQNDSVIKLVYIGNYIRGKGHDYALKAFIEAYRQDSRLRLYFYGGDMGLQKNKVFREELEALAQRHDLSAVVHFLPFAIDVEAEYKSADIFLNFSEAESFSMTCAEAAYYGVPTIASRCGGPEEIIVHGETGLLVSNQNVAAFATAILRLSADIGLRQKFALASPVYVQEKFSPNHFKACFLPLIQPALSVSLHG